MLSEYIMIGKVLKSQGVKGEVKVLPQTDHPERFEALTEVFIEKNGEYTTLSVEDVSVRNQFVFLRLDHAATCDEAEKQRDWCLYVDRAHAVKLPENHYFICDLIGCEVFDDEEKKIGVISDVLQPCANDVYEIKAGKKMIYVPVLRDLILSVDVENKKIVLKKSRFDEVAVLED